MTTEERINWNLKADGFNPNWAFCCNCKNFTYGKGKCSLIKNDDLDIGETGYCSFYEGDGIEPEYPNIRPPQQFNLSELNYLLTVVNSQFWESADKQDIVNKLQKLLGMKSEAQNPDVVAIGFKISNIGAGLI